MRYASLLAGVALWAGIASAQTVTPGVQLPAKHKALEVHVSGRVASETSATGTAYKHQWPGVYFEAAFSGDRVFLAFDDPYNIYRLHIDDLAPVAITQPGAGSVEVSGLANGKHSLRLEKLSESSVDTAAFKGFYVTDGGKGLPVVPRARQIEFIGDSGMVGYGTHSTTVACTGEEVHKLTDTQAAWPALTARHFNADYQVNAISGRGVIRNYSGALSGQALSDVYPFTFFDKTVPYAAEDWQPQIVVVSQGGNDMTPLQPGEQWTNMDQMGNALVAGFGRLIVGLHQRYPSAIIVVQLPLPDGDAARNKALDAARLRIEAEGRAAGIDRLAFMDRPKDFKVDMSGCHYHPSVAGQRTAADWSIRWLEERPELWQGK